MSFDKRNYAPDVPYIHGMRVCLNPEYSEYHRLNQDVRGNAGYVIQSDAASEDTLMKWKHFSPTTRSDHYCKVEWDNGYRSDYSFYMLLHVDSSPRDTVYIRLNSGSHFGLPERIYPMVDKLVFESGAKVRSIVIFDDEWREKKLKLLDA